jgi:hypothetical protein
MERISFDVKANAQIDVLDSKTATLTYKDTNTVTYTITNSGQIQRNGQIICEYINFDHSFFTEVSNSLIVNLLLEDKVLGRAVRLPVMSQIFPRNRL